MVLSAALLIISCARDAKRVPPRVADELFQQRDSALLRAGEYSDTVEIRYAQGLKVSYETDGIHVQISNPDPAVRHAQTEEIVITEPHRRFICTTALQ